MTRIDQLRKRFASGMAQGTISAEDWEAEFLPMLEDAERYRWLRSSDRMPDEINKVIDKDDFRLDAAIDAARTPTKEQV